MAEQIIEIAGDEISPCRVCKYEKEDKLECMTHCKRLIAFQQGHSYANIAHYEKAFQDSSKEPEVPKIKKPTAQKTDWKKAIPKKVVGASIKKTNNLCIFPGCTKKAERRKNTICLPCYQAWRRGKKDHPMLGEWKTLTTEEIANDRLRKFKECLVEGCSKMGNKRELCEQHYKKWHKGNIKHPKFGTFKRKDGKMIKPKVKKTSMDNPYNTIQSEIIENKVTIDFTNYHELYQVIKKIGKLQYLPINHAIINLIAAGIIWGEKKIAAESEI